MIAAGGSETLPRPPRLLPPVSAPPIRSTHYILKARPKIRAPFRNWMAIDSRPSCILNYNSFNLQRKTQQQ